MAPPPRRHPDRLPSLARALYTLHADQDDLRATLPTYIGARTKEGREVYEVKFDGYGCQLHKQGDEVTLYPRYGFD